MAIAVLTIGVLALVGSGSSSGSGAKKSSSDAHPPAKDVAITTCALPDNQFLGPQAKLTVTNHSSKASNYIITVAFESPDGKTQLDTATAIVNKLGPGQVAPSDASSVKADLRTTNTPFTCKVSDVTRFASP